MATITITAVATSFSPPAKVFTMTDGVMTRIIAAYQSDANVSVNGTATSAQVMNYITNLWRDQIKAKVQQVETPAPVVPAQPTIT